MLARISGKSFREEEEASAATTSFNLVRSIRLRRFRWLGHMSARRTQQADLSGGHGTVLRRRSRKPLHGCAPTHLSIPKINWSQSAYLPESQEYTWPKPTRGANNDDRSVDSWTNSAYIPDSIPIWTKPTIGIESDEITEESWAAPAYIPTTISTPPHHVTKTPKSLGARPLIYPQPYLPPHTIHMGGKRIHPG